MTVAIYGRSIEPEFFPYLKRLVEGLERKGVGMVCEEKFAALLSGNYGYEPKFLNCFGRCTLIKEEVELLLSVGGDGTFLDSVIYVKDSGFRYRKKIKLTWTSANNAQGYYIYRSDGMKKEKQIAKVEGYETKKWCDSNVKAGKTYSYRIVPFCKSSGVAGMWIFRVGLLIICI